ncbi:MAG: hypothetical protein RRB13_10690 [bacterium]|nr:hypothetical protein [bacterium]
MTVFLESQTGLGLILPQATHNAWENIFWDNHHVSSWVAEAQNRGSRLLGGSLNVAALENVEVQWVFEDGSTDRLTYPSATITNLDPLVRKVYYAEYDQTTPANSLIKVLELPQFADFAPTEFQFPLVQVGFKQEGLETSTAFVKWIAPRDPQGASAQVMPVGTILMYDGTNWQDNVTMKGWYACVGGTVPANLPGAGTLLLDLRDQFVKGRTDVETAGSTGGLNSFSLNTGQLPSHFHSIDHKHPSTDFDSRTDIGGRDGIHNHNIAYNSGVWGIGGYGISGGGNYNTPTDLHSKLQEWNNAAFWAAEKHQHRTSVDLPNYSGGSGLTGSGDPIDNRPSYYAVIYIKRIA